MGRLWRLRFRRRTPRLRQPQTSKRSRARSPRSTDGRPAGPVLGLHRGGGGRGGAGPVPPRRSHRPSCFRARSTATRSSPPNVTVNQDTAGAPQNETAIAVDPNNPNRIVAGANDYVSRTWTCTVSGTPCSALGDGYSGTYFSNDGGADVVLHGDRPVAPRHADPGRRASRPAARTTRAATPPSRSTAKATCTTPGWASTAPARRTRWR